MKKCVKMLITYLLNFLFIFRIKMGKGSTIAEGLILNGSRKQKIVLGDNVSIGRYARLGNCSEGIK